MDSSTRQSFLQGTLAVPAGELTPQDWAAFFEHLLCPVSPCLKHARGFKPIQEYLESLRPLEIPAKSLRFAEGISLKTRAYSLDEHPRVGTCGNEDMVMVVSRLLLGETGGLIQWTLRETERVGVLEGSGRFGMPPTIRKFWEATEVSLIWLEGESLKKFIAEYPFWPTKARALVGSLKSILETSQQSLTTRLAMNRLALSELLASTARLSW